MDKPVLYLMVGYPGAGKTTVSKIIHELTGATHLWADHERRTRYDHPTHSHQENIELYEDLNAVTEDLLATGKSVIFDTNFNFYKDRQKLREIAAKHGAQTKLIWVRTPKDLARQRATHGLGQDTRVLGDMPAEQFERISSNMQPPGADEKAIEIQGTEVSPEYIKQTIGI